MLLPVYLGDGGVHELTDHKVSLVVCQPQFSDFQSAFLTQRVSVTSIAVTLVLRSSGVVVWRAMLCRLRC